MRQSTLLQDSATGWEGLAVSRLQVAPCMLKEEQRRAKGNTEPDTQLSMRPSPGSRRAER